MLMQNESLALLTDLYQLTMAYCYWKENIHEKEASFYYFFRKKPFQGEFAVSAGLETLIEFIEKFHFTQDDIAYLASLKGADNDLLFSRDFLDFLATFSFKLNIDAVEEGTIVFPSEPLIRVTGPILHAQLLESPLLNIMNFQTLIATKSARINLAAAPNEVVEFGMRRAQGVDGAITASRAAFIGGCASTSNVIAGKKYNIPVKGTQAHSWVMAFDEEKDAFIAFAKHMPGNSVLLIDTYDSVEGTKKAIEVAKDLRKHGHELLGVRLDSG
ncbi:MAG: nicotinate phosphoribosyltransferase, partial [Chlamydiales bacterium]|nr:nicotinate phosphoribosyltransferase [Chlamydiales bacterium]